jgi:hypothetical protein
VAHGGGGYGAGAGPAANTTSALQQQFCGERIVERLLWPPLSPDLTQPEVSLMGFIREKVLFF